MSAPIMREDWEALVEVLDMGIKRLDDKRIEPVKQSLLEFSSTAAMLGLTDLANAAVKFQEFLFEAVAPEWDEEAVATLSLSMKGLRENMDAEEYGPRFVEGLKEYLAYLEFYREGMEASLPAQAAEAEAATAEVAQAGAAAPAASKPKSVMEPQVEGFKLESAKKAEKTSPAMKEEALPESVISPASAAEAGYVMDKVYWYRELLSHDPTSKAFVALAEELCSRHAWQEAIETCRNGLRYHPQNLRGRILLGWALWESGDFGPAEQILADARGELEKNAVLYKILAEAAAKKGEPEQSTELLKIYKSIQPSLAPSSSAPARESLSETTVEAPAIQIQQAEAEELEAGKEIRSEAVLEEAEIKEAEMELPVEAAEEKTTEPPIAFFCRFLEKYSRKPAGKFEGSTLFAEEDREALVRILARGTA